MSAISAVSDVMAQYMMMRPPPGPPPPPPAAKSEPAGDRDRGESDSASDDSPNGKLLDITA